MAYYDPYAIQDPYGYDPYGFDQTLDDSPIPEPSKDWVDVPKRNRSYLKKLPKNIIKDDFIHLKTEQIYCIEVMVENIHINEELVPETNDKKHNDIVIGLKIMNFPELELKLFHSSSIDNGKHDTALTDQSATSLPIVYPPLSALFQRLLSYSAGIAEEVEDEPEAEVEKEENDEEVEWAEQMEQERKATLNENQNEPLEELPKRVEIEVMEGNNVLLVMTGMEMVQKLQTQVVNVFVGRNKIIEIEEDVTTETDPLGAAATRFPQTFHKAVLRRSSVKNSFPIPLIGDEGEVVGEVDMVATLLCVGQGVEIEMSGPTFYRNVKLIETFPPERVESIFDPVVHPRLAVTLMNMEPPLRLNRTSSEIIKACLESNIIPFEGEEGNLPAKYTRKNCRWLEIARELSVRSSKLSFLSGSDMSPRKTSTELKQSDLPWPLSMLRCPRTEVDPEIDRLWTGLRLKCKGLWEEVEEIEKNHNALYEELDELLRQDKGEGWGSESSSERSDKSKTSAGSMSSKRSVRKSTLKQSIIYD